MHHICIWFYNNLALTLSIWLFSGNRHKVFLVLYAFLYGILALCTIFVFDLLNQFDAETLISFTIITTPIWSLFVLKGIFYSGKKNFHVLFIRCQQLILNLRNLIFFFFHKIGIIYFERAANYYFCFEKWTVIFSIFFVFFFISIKEILTHRKNNCTCFPKFCWSTLRHNCFSD